MSQCYLLFARGKIQKTVVNWLNPELHNVLADKVVRKKIEDQGDEVESSPLERLNTLVQKEVVRWKSVVIAAKIKVE